MRLTYRLGTDDDLPAVRRLWEAHTNWGTVTEALWQRYVVEPPFGGVTMVVADDPAGEVVGSFAFLPQLVSVGGREVRSCRPLAAAIADTARGGLALNPLQHPAIAMYLRGAEAMRARGDALIYLVPDPRWGRVLRVLPWFRTGSFPLWKLPLPLAAPLPLGDGCRVVPVAPEDPRVDALWGAARAQYRCAVVRDRRTLPWKLWSGEYDVVGVERGGELVGLSASRAKGDRQWLVCDVLAADAGPALRATRHVEPAEPGEPRQLGGA